MVMSSRGVSSAAATTGPGSISAVPIVEGLLHALLDKFSRHQTMGPVMAEMMRKAEGGAKGADAAKTGARASTNAGVAAHTSDKQIVAMKETVSNLGECGAF